MVASRASFAAGRVSSSSPPPPPPPPPSPPKPLQPSFPPPPHGDRCGRSDCLRGPEQLGVCFWCRVTLRFWVNTFRQVGQVRTSDIVTTRHQRPDAMHARERDEFPPSGGSFSAACCLLRNITRKQQQQPHHGQPAPAAATASQRTPLRTTFTESFGRGALTTAKTVVRAMHYHHHIPSCSHYGRSLGPHHQRQTNQ